MSKHGKVPDWYNKDSEFERALNDDTKNSKITNTTIEKILKRHNVKTVFDLSCGTGSQVFYLIKRGYNVIGSDISRGMLKIAKKKSQQEKVKVTLLHGDMRTIQAGQFDAAITIFNAIGHLTKSGFEKAMCNIHHNLNESGIYIFDILNLNHVLKKNNISTLSMDRITSIRKTKLREIQHSIIDHQGILTSYTTYYAQKGAAKPTVSKTVGTLQLYTVKELKMILAKNGFNVLGQYGIDGSKFSDKKTERIVMVAKKK